MENETTEHTYSNMVSITIKEMQEDRRLEYAAAAILPDTFCVFVTATILVDDN